MMTTRFRLIIGTLVLVVGSLLLSLCKGSTSISLDQLLFNHSSAFDRIFLQLRLPRTLSAFITGGLLALSGALMQILLHNPLADPYVLGVSGGAALGALIVMLFGLGESWLLGGAWIGSLLAILLILSLSPKHRWQSGALLLCGIALACGFSAGISFLLFISPDYRLHSLLFWLSGDLNGAEFPWLGIAVLILGTLIAIALAPGLTILSRGDQAAEALGLACQRYRIILYLLSSFLTATAVSIAGCVGFVGLIIPHITRFLYGNDQRLVLPLSTLLGGTLLTLADTGARTLLAPIQIPVGILMTLIGVPILIGLLQT